MTVRTRSQYTRINRSDRPARSTQEIGTIFSCCTVRSDCTIDTDPGKAWLKFLVKFCLLSSFFCVGCLLSVCGVFVKRVCGVCLCVWDVRLCEVR